MGEKVKNTSQAERILNAAFRCISEKGYANVSSRDIANEAGVALSQLNYYYKNKEGLFKKVIEMLFKKYFNEIENNLKKGTTKSESSVYLIKYFKETLIKKPELFKIFFDLTSMALWSESLKKFLKDLFDSLAKLIEKYIVNDSIKYENLKSCSPSSLSRLILGTLFGTSIQLMMTDKKEECLNTLSTLELILS
ncbi:MAG TPA: TetR/AcrR family transcriptional regulator [Clostridium sp.]|jgi:AcrR family transcriptional regulator|uniref:TetR/AcrR family transcriptional regulator n=1 Tax=Clostridium lapidicellarium TaxID=3240931 RepID=A0ABV4DXD4_9CLOT|nr:TetR/AcrR family transcriptional regulator [uncultured Clostridium sp.]HBC96223.1 TetR/AcrR family transcriptional regulator [Clostridium sp.]